MSRYRHPELTARPGRAAGGQGGFVLLSCIIIMVVMALLALSMFRSVGIQHRIAGIVRDKEVALTAAVAAERYAEWWVSEGNGASTANNTCTNGVTTVTQSCDQSTQDLSSPSTLPWTVSGTNVGTTYSPSSLTVANGSTPVANAVAKAPGYYIVLLPGRGFCPGSNIFQIYAYGYGGSSNTSAVVQSQYLVGDGSLCPDR